MTRSRISGIGFHVPPRVVRNADLEQLMDTSDAWIIERTGIRERRFADAGVGSSALGLEAAKRAIADAGRQAQDVDFIIFATTTPDFMFPGLPDGSTYYGSDMSTVVSGNTCSCDLARPRNGGPQALTAMLSSLALAGLLIRRRRRR